MTKGRGEVVRLDTAWSDARIVEGLLRRDPAAGRVFFDRHAPTLARVLRRLLGPDDVEDALQDVLTEAVQHLHSLREPDALRGWLVRIAIHVTRRRIRTRQRKRWLTFFRSEEMPEPAIRHDGASADTIALHAAERVLASLDDEDRMVFVLRYVEGFELTECAAAIGVSLATLKRRLGRATESFGARARNEPALLDWIERGHRWTT